MKLRTIFISLAIAVLLTGCATTTQKKRGMDDNDARREAFWTGVFSAIGHAITGGDDKPAK